MARLFDRKSGVRVRRKNLYLPCAIAADTDNMSDEEYLRVLKANAWADRITEAEWRVLLGEDRNPSAKSRLKKKLAEWMVAEGRVAMLSPDIYLAAVREAKRIYAEQIGSPNPLFPEIESD